jgi:cephalosporin hydroxylase
MSTPGDIYGEWYCDKYIGNSDELHLSWGGVPLIKHPNDLMMLQEIIWKTRPTLIIETGTKYGGSALFMATILDMIGSGRLVTIDVRPSLKEITHDRVSQTVGSSLEANVTVRGDDRVMVVLDSCHHARHVRLEMERFGPLVTPGCYMVVEDTSPHLRRLRGDPALAVAGFLEDHPGMFEADGTSERLGFTTNPGGFLRRSDD